MGGVRGQPGVAALGGKLYAVGRTKPERTPTSQTAEVYDPVDNSWNPIASMNERSECVHSPAR